MTYDLEIRPDALADIAEAAKWYEEREPGLGTEFVRAIREGIKKLSSNPLAHQIRNRRRNVRWFLASRFPYKIIYRVQGQQITIIAVVRSARRDDYWKVRQ